MAQLAHSDSGPSSLSPAKPPSSPYSATATGAGEGTEPLADGAGQPRALMADQAAPGLAVRAEISRTARESLRGYPLAASLLRSDLLASVANLRVGPPEPGLSDMVQRALEPFSQALDWFGDGLRAQSNHDGGPAERAEWVDSQLRIANRLVDRLGPQTPLVFSAAPRPPDPPARAGDGDGHVISGGAGPSSGGPSLGQRAPWHPDRAFYARFLHDTLQAQLSHLLVLSPSPPRLCAPPPASLATSAAPVQRPSCSPDPLDMALTSRARSKVTRSPPGLSLSSDLVPFAKRPRPSLSVVPAPCPETPGAVRPTPPRPLPPSRAAKTLVSPASLDVSWSPTQPAPHPGSSKRSERRFPKAYRPAKPSDEDAGAALVGLVEDILEADDMAAEDRSDQLFGRIGSEALLSPPVLTHLTRLVDQSDGQIIAQVPCADLARLIKILERGVKATEDLTVIPVQLKAKTRLPHSSASHNSPPLSEQSPLAKRRSTGVGVSKAAQKQRPLTSGAGGEKGPPSEEQDLESQIEEDATAHGGSVEHCLQDLFVGLHSVNAVLALLVCERHLPKQLYSEQLIRAILSAVKEQLAGVVYPFLDMRGGGGSQAHRQRLERLLSSSSIISQRVSLAFSFISTSIIPRICTLIDRVELSESILIHIGYVAIAPFFVEVKSRAPGVSASGKSYKVTQADGALKSMRLGCLQALRNLSCRYPGQREWLVEEILGCVSNLTEQPTRNSRALYPLANGKSIQTISALLLHIVQCCMSGTRARVAAILNNSHHKLLEGLNSESDVPPLPSQVSGGPKTESPVGSIIEIIEPGVSSAAKLGKKIISFLLQKSCRNSKTARGASYRGVLDGLVEDLINLVFLPDWPVAEFMLSLCCKTMMGLLESSKLSAEANAIKTLCLDYLGPITAKLIEPPRADTLNLQQGLPVSFKAMVAASDRSGLTQLFNLQKSVLSFLGSSIQARDPIETAADFLSAQWILDNAHALQNVQTCMKSAPTKAPSGELSQKHGEDSQAQLIGDLQSRIDGFSRLESVSSTTLQNQCNGEDLFVSLREGRANEVISYAHGLKGTAKVLLERILASSGSSSVTFRGKAVKALALVVARDPTVFFEASVRKSIENRMLDSSPAVRDATIELVGKYVVGRPDLAVAFLPQISARIVDKGVSVRRRVVKLLKAIYLILNDEDWLDLKVEISHRLISRVSDEDTSIKDLSLSSIQELWFDQSTSKTFDVGSVSTIIMGIVALQRDLLSPLEGVLKLLIRQHSRKGQQHLDAFTRCCQDIVDCLIDQLMDIAATARDSNFSEVECIKTVCIFATTCPKLLAPAKAVMLLPYLKGAVTPSEQAIVLYLLKIFRACATEAPRSSAAFGTRLQGSLLILVNKPNLNGGAVVLQELMACFCAVVIHQTHDYDKLFNVFKACGNRLGQEVDRLEKGSIDSECKSLPLLMYLASALVAYGEFDKLPCQKDLQERLLGLSPLPVHLHVYNLLLNIYHARMAGKIRSVVLACLGFLFRTYPDLMTRSESLNIMDEVFALDSRTDTELQLRLVKLIAEFLDNQAERLRIENNKGDPADVDMDQLIGSAEKFADSGVGSAIVQRYLPQIAALAQSLHVPTQNVAVDVISCTIQQGLAHPLQCVPVLVALEGSPDENVSKRALGLHMILHVQRANLVHCRFLETFRQAYEYHIKATGNSRSAPGYIGSPPRSVMAAWYQLLSEKRAWKIDFLKALVKPFSVDPQHGIEDFKGQGVGFAQYVAEGLMTLDFKTEEEVLVVVDSLNESTGQNAYQTLQSLGGHQATGLLGDLESVSAEGIDTPHPHDLVAFRASIVLGIGFVLRNLLKEIYGISDQKLIAFARGLEKSELKKMKETSTRRKINESDVCVRFEQDLKRKLPGLAGAEEFYKQHIVAFSKMVKEDCEVLSGGEENDSEMLPEGEEDALGEGCEDEMSFEM